MINLEDHLSKEIMENDLKKIDDIEGEEEKTFDKHEPGIGLRRETLSLQKTNNPGSGEKQGRKSRRINVELKIKRRTKTVVPRLEGLESFKDRN